MVHVDLEILHELKGRMRLKLEKPFSNSEVALEYLNAGGIYNCTYNQMLNTLLVQYQKQSRNEVLSRVAAIYASQCGLQYVHILNNTQNFSKISASSKLAIVAMVANTGMHMFLPKHPLTLIANWCSVGTTIGTILEHAYQEISIRGSFDPEVMSVVYLLNAVSRGQGLYATPAAWFLTFGRHIFADRNKEIMLKVVARKQKGAYNVSVLKNMNAHKGVTVLGETLSKFISTNTINVTR